MSIEQTKVSKHRIQERLRTDGFAVSSKVSAEAADYVDRLEEKLKTIAHLVKTEKYLCYEDWVVSADLVEAELERLVE